MEYYKEIIERTKIIESKLQNLGANGRGLNEKVSSIEDKIKFSTVKSIRFLATIRNKLMHVNGFQMTPELYNNFIDVNERVLKELDNQNNDTFYTRLHYPKNYSDTSTTNNRSKKSNIEAWLNIAVFTIGFIVFIAYIFTPLSLDELNANMQQTKNRIAIYENSIDTIKTKLTIEKNKQGVLRNLFYDTEEVDKLQEELDNLQDELLNLKENEIEIKKEIQETYNLK